MLAILQKGIVPKQKLWIFRKLIMLLTKIWFFPLPGNGSTLPRILSGFWLIHLKLHLCRTHRHHAPSLLDFPWKMSWTFQSCALYPHKLACSSLKQGTQCHSSAFWRLPLWDLHWSGLQFSSRTCIIHSQVYLQRQVKWMKTVAGYYRQTTTNSHFSTMATSQKKPVFLSPWTNKIIHTMTVV